MNAGVVDVRRSRRDLLVAAGAEGFLTFIQHDDADIIYTLKRRVARSSL